MLTSIQNTDLTKPALTDENEPMISILDVVNFGDQTPPKEEIVPEQKSSITNQNLNEIIDDSQFQFFAQSERIKEGFRVELTNDDGMGYVG